MICKCQPPTGVLNVSNEYLAAEAALGNLHRIIKIHARTFEHTTKRQGRVPRGCHQLACRQLSDPPVAGPQMVVGSRKRDALLLIWGLPIALSVIPWP